MEGHYGNLTRMTDPAQSPPLPGDSALPFQEPIGRESALLHGYRAVAVSGPSVYDSVKIPEEDTERILYQDDITRQPREWKSRDRANFLSPENANH